MRRALGVLAAVGLLAANAAGSAGAGESLYRASTVVTGRSPESLAAGLPRCLAAVLVKVSGDPRLGSDPAAAKLAGDARAMVASATFRDRMAGIPVHDEQGSRERPHVLTVDFDPDRIDAALEGLGRRPWPQPRPRLSMRLTVRNGDTGFALTEDGAKGRDMREALADAAERFGLDVELPRAEGQRDGERAGLVPLAGSLTWDPGKRGWSADWRLEAPGGGHAWSVGGVSFDEAFRSGIGGSAQVLSGNGEPG